MKLIRRIIGKCISVVYLWISCFFSKQGKVLMLHWVEDNVIDEEHEPYRISTKQFKSFLNWLKHKNIIHLIDWEGEKDFYALTIDDVPVSFYENAYPLLIEAEIPFTLFVNLSLLDTDKYISTQQLIEMSESKLCTIGSHGIEHGEFTLMNSDQVIRDLQESKERLEDIIGKSVNMYAYPYGSYYACGYSNKHLTEIVYKYSFSTLPCPITKSFLQKKYFLPRINVESKFLK